MPHILFNKNLSVKNKMENEKSHTFVYTIVVET